MTTPWKILEEQYYARFHVFSAKRSRRENPSTGKPFDFFLMEGLDWTSVILLTKKREIVLVQQYRHGSECVTLELPGGAIELGESPAVGAAREVLEETGYSSAALQLLGSVFANPAMQSMKLHVFIGETDGKPQFEQNLDSEEEIKIVVKPFDEFLVDVREGRAQHALTTAAVGMYLLSKGLDP